MTFWRFLIYSYYKNSKTLTQISKYLCFSCDEKVDLSISLYGDTTALFDSSGELSSFYILLAYLIITITHSNKEFRHFLLLSVTFLLWIFKFLQKSLFLRTPIHILLDMYFVFQFCIFYFLAFIVSIATQNLIKTIIIGLQSV